MSRRSGTLQLTTPLQSGEIVFRLGKVVAVFRGEAPHSVGEGLIDAGLCDVMQYQEMLAKQKEGVTGGALFAAFGLAGEGLDTTLEELLKRAVYGMFEWKEGTFSFVLEDQPDPWRGFTIDGARIVVERGLNPQYLAIEGARLRDEHDKNDPVENFIAKTQEAASPAAAQANSDALARSLRPNERADEDFSQVHLESAAPILPEAKPVRVESEKVIPFPGGRGRRDNGKLALARAEQPEETPTVEVSLAQLKTANAAAVDAGASDQAADSVTAPADVAVSQPAGGDAEPPASAVPTEAEAPAATSVEPAYDAPAMAPGTVSPWRLLVVDDDAQVLQHLTTTFAPRFTEVLSAATVGEALAHLQAHPTGVVVATDLIISRSDDSGILGGIEVLEAARAVHPNTPVFLFTDYQNEEAQARATQLGVNAQLLKPRKAQIYGDGRRGITAPMRDFIGRLDTLFAPYISAAVDVPVSDAPAPESQHIDIRQELGASAEAAGPVTEPGGIDMATLRSMIAELRDPSNRDAVALLVLRFASSLFERGALFLATRRYFVGLGGFSQTEASDQFVLRVRDLQVPVELESLFSKVARFRALVRGPLEDTAGNRRLISGLGSTWHNHETVAAPLISGDRVAAILFGDNPSNKPVGNMDGLEIFMQQAGLVMERALLERKLEESRQKDPTKK